MAENKVALEGRITEPELRFLPSGLACCRFSIVYNRQKRNEEGKWVDADAHWFECEAFGRSDSKPGLAEMISEIPKGQILHIEGSLRQNKWEDNDGRNHTRTVVVVTRVHLPMFSLNQFTVEGTDILFRRRAVRTGAEETVYEPNEEPF